MRRASTVVAFIVGSIACGSVVSCSCEPPDDNGDSGLPQVDAAQADRAVADRAAGDHRQIDAHTTDSRIADARTADAHTADNHLPDTRATDSRLSDSATPDTSAPDAGAAWDGGPCVDPPPTPDRPSGTTCSLCRPPGPDPGGVQGDCTADTDCSDGINGRCSLGQIGAYCSYDLCFSDDHCASDQVCSCDGDSFSGANRCVSANCHVNSDCVSGRCSPSYGCLQGGQPEGWYCRTAADECASDAVCTDYAAGRCAYSSTLSHWACEYGVCIP